MGRWITAPPFAHLPADAGQAAHWLNETRKAHARDAQAPRYLMRAYNGFSKGRAADRST